MKKVLKLHLCLLSVTLTLGGCSNPYQKFYRPNASVANSAIQPIKVSGEPEILPGSSNPRQDVLTMFEHGYEELGSSDFVGTAQGRAGVIEQAKKVGAAKVLVYSRYRNTVRGQMPLTLPTTTTSYSSGIVNTSGPGGVGMGNYSGMTTTYGTQTTYIPYSIEKYEQHAIYFVPMERKGLGIISYPLSDADKQALGSNKGLRIIAIRNGSPAFKADILPGDLLISLHGEDVYDTTSEKQALVDATGHESTVILFRAGKQITKTVDIPSGDW